MINKEDLLEDVEELLKPLTISTAKSGENLRATKASKLRLKSVIGLNKIKKIELYDVFFVPGLEENLLSVRKASLHGKRVTFKNKEVIFEHGTEVIGKGEFAEGLFYLDCIWDGKSEAEEARGSAYVVKQASFDTWHRRLGHIICGEKLYMLPHI